MRRCSRVWQTICKLGILLLVRLALIAVGVANLVRNPLGDHVCVVGFVVRGPRVGSCSSPATPGPSPTRHGRMSPTIGSEYWKRLSETILAYAAARISATWKGGSDHARGRTSPHNTLPGEIRSPALGVTEARFDERWLPLTNDSNGSRRRVCVYRVPIEAPPGAWPLCMRLRSDGEQAGRLRGMRYRYHGRVTRQRIRTQPQSSHALPPTHHTQQAERDQCQRCGLGDLSDTETYAAVLHRRKVVREHRRVHAVAVEAERPTTWPAV